MPTPKKVVHINDGPSSRVKLSSEVIKALTDLGLTADAVLREVLKVESHQPDAFIADGVIFPEGTYFRTWYKDRAYWAVVHNGLIELQGREYSSVSAAAASITGRPTTNGWEFWECRKPKSVNWVRLNKLKQSS